jgi:hypothetical protein
MPGQVTIADLFRVLTSIQSDLGRAVTKLEVLESRNTLSDQQHQDFETRIRSLEAAAIRTKTVATTVASAAGVVAGIIADLISHAH